ncbi:D-alanyl-D-alanine carboxypeptidase/D-alanyl-D-alanine endopeptidase [Tenggerimyces flavus]|uniref:D-alanyl-D-alanine carboxypeptidase/D-alanyl-D-alanine-endopeptidase n=1 Tax=Tenggerimyces flavus TaxID=1708749 RepID=A0ABV7YEP8_9ACTN|nr:D-alanyl-D-alanine carboxypeptidase/D-alanyl-D-alanine-endopeptidase [Tenggerimyces flavus]MBM7784296.1 D-alanyl-D-alanine carboxypeptidase/D-alanyl-D-alanine-endopeptidase (penicillin-binding protein 4) [Tenggerimyces flavus]
MRRTFRQLLVAGSSAVLLSGSVALPQLLDAPKAATPVDTLVQDLNTILSQPGVPEAHASVLVRGADGGVLYEKEASERLLPASNAKLFSSTAALEVLGADHRFPTSVLSTASVRGSVLRGDLYLRGQGDPTLLAKDYDDLAAKVAASGVKLVRGNLVADDTWYDAVRLGNSWGWDDEPYYYNMQISALTVSPNTDYDAGTVIVETRPGATVGAPAQLKVVPETSYVKLVNKATTKASGSTSMSVERQHGTNVIEVTGSIALGASVDQEWATVWEPTGYAADVFRRALTRHGVKVLGGTTYAATPAGAGELARHESMTVGELLVPFMKLSNNGHAEVLVKEMGRKVSGEGSWDAGLAAMTTALEGLGVNMGTIRIVDGSGLSRQDFLTPVQVTNLLRGAESQPWFDTWYASMPIACKNPRFEGGTLRSRMCNTEAAGNVHAKTGSLTRVTALGGYVTSKDGERLTFSIILNYFDASLPAKGIEDQIAIRLANFSRTAPPSVRVPALKRSTGPADVECSWVKAC